MDKFKLKGLCENINQYQNSGLYSFMEMFEYILDSNYRASEQVVYFKNLYKYTNNQCTLNDLSVSTIIDNKFYFISYDEVSRTCSLKMYKLNDISHIQLNRRRKSYNTNLKLTISFNNGDLFTFDNYEDTYESICSDALRSIILDFYNIIQSF